MKNVNYRHILPAIAIVVLAGVFISASSKTTEGLPDQTGALQSITTPISIIASNNESTYNTQTIPNSTDAVSNTKLAEYAMANNYTGSWRIKYDYRCTIVDGYECAFDGVTGHFNIYKNDVAYGSGASSENSAYATKSEDFANISISSGDKIQVYAYVPYGFPSTYYAEIQNFIIYFDIVGDGAAPQYSQNQTNSSASRSSVKHSLYWADDSGLSGYIFSFDNGTGIFSNDTFVAMTGTGNWSNITKSINTTVGATIRWRIFANDIAGNTNTSEIFSFATTAQDTTPPDITILSPLSASYATADIDLNYTLVDADSGVNAASCAYVLDAGATTTLPGCGNETLFAIPDGTHTITVYSSDNADNLGSTSVSFTVNATALPSPDTSAPVLSNPQPSGTITVPNTTLSVGTDENAACRYSTIPNTLYDAMISPTTAMSMQHIWPLSGLANGYYVYYIRCADLAGNQNIADYTVAFAVNATLPSDALNFSLSLDSSGDVEAGKNKTTDLKIKPLSESSGIVNLSCSNLPSGVSCIFRKSAINITGGDSKEIKLTFATSKETITGRYNISVRGTSGGITKSANYLLKIKSDEETTNSCSHD